MALNKIGRNKQQVIALTVIYLVDFYFFLIACSFFRGMCTLRQKKKKKKNSDHVSNIFLRDV